MRNFSLFRNWRPYLEEDNGGSAGGAGGAGGNDDNGGKNDSDTKSFDDILKEHPEYQAELDRRLHKASDTAAANAKKKIQAMYDDKLDEQEKMKDMTEDEKAEYQRRKKEKELSEREAAVTRRELLAKAKEILIEKGVDPKLAEMADLTDEDKCKASCDSIVATFNKSVEDAVNEKLKGKKPPKDSRTEGDDDNKTSAVEKEIANGLHIKI